MLPGGIFIGTSADVERSFTPPYLEALSGVNAALLRHFADTPELK